MNVVGWLVIAWAVLGCLGWCFIFLVSIVRIRGLPVLDELRPATPARWPRLSVLIAARDEEEAIGAALRTRIDAGLPDAKVDRLRGLNGALRELAPEPHKPPPAVPRKPPQLRPFRDSNHGQVLPADVVPIGTRSLSPRTARVTPSTVTPTVGKPPTFAEFVKQRGLIPAEVVGDVLDQTGRPA